jgi:hypothetical protein
MEHLEFVEKLNQLGCTFRSTNIENIIKTIEISNSFGESDFIEIKNFQCKYKKSNRMFGLNPLQEVIRKAIDIDSWKHSWDNEIEPENYEKFSKIIQEKMIKRAEEMDFLTTIYFQLQYELSKKEN